MSRKKNLSLNEEKEITRRYMLGESCERLKKEYGIRSLRKVVLRSGGTTFSSEYARSKFKTQQQCQNLRCRYEAGENTKSLAKEYDVTSDTITRAIRRVGGQVFRRPRKYFFSFTRERQIKFTYGIVVSEMEKLKTLQKCMCLWCFAPLPENVLDCVIDHIGGVKTRGDKTKVRGLCCKNGHCNRIAGMVEAGKFSSNSLFRPFILRVRKVIRQCSNGGPLS